MGNQWGMWCLNYETDLSTSITKRSLSSAAEDAVFGARTASGNRGAREPVTLPGMFHQPLPGNPPEPTAQALPQINGQKKKGMIEKPVH